MDNKLTAEGHFCTTDPADLEFPLKILFVIDVSASMDVSDPPDTTILDPTERTGRARAIKAVISQFIDLNTQVSAVTCDTSAAGCDKGNPACPKCASVGGAGGTCVGPDCCNAPPCPGESFDLPACPATDNGVCYPLCDNTKPGCMPGESNCPDCPNPGDRCLSGICGKNLDPSVEFAIMRFGSAKQVLTQRADGNEGFTNDAGQLLGALPQVSNAGGFTDYEGALTKVFEVIDNDIRYEKEINASTVSRNRYVTIFLTDGLQDPQNKRCDLLGPDRPSGSTGDLRQ